MSTFVTINDLRSTLDASGRLRTYIPDHFCFPRPVLCCQGSFEEGTNLVELPLQVDRRAVCQRKCAILCAPMFPAIALYGGIIVSISGFVLLIGTPRNTHHSPMPPLPKVNLGDLALEFRFCVQPKLHTDSACLVQVVKDRPGPGPRPLIVVDA